LEELRRLRKQMKLSQAKLAVLANLDPSTVNQIEVGARQPNTKTLEKIAAVLEVDVAELFPRAQFPLPFEDASSLEELHAQAGCATDWLIKPEDEWIATWHQNLTPREAIRIVRETAAEWDSVKPLIAEQERNLPPTKTKFNGPYKKAWSHYFGGFLYAEDCGVANGVIVRGENLNVLAKRLGQKPLEGLPFAS